MNFVRTVVKKFSHKSQFAGVHNFYDSKQYYFLEGLNNIQKR